MKIYKKNIFKNTQELEIVLSKNSYKISYVNLYSIGVNKNYVIKDYVLIDGWPIVTLLKHIYGIEVQLMSFYNMKSFWMNFIKKNRIVIAGYSIDDHEDIKNYFVKAGFDAPQMIDGYLSDDDLKCEIEANADKVIFLGIGQPRQEMLLEMLDDNCRVICCGAFFKQVAGIEHEYSGISKHLGLTVFMRFWKDPIMLLKRTLIPIFRIRGSFL